MLLRRHSENVRSQNWIAVTLDFLIVVTGVFIGFQLTAWNAARQDRVLEKQYLERLYADVRGTLVEFQDNASWDEERLSSLATVLNALRSGTLDETDKDAFDRGLVFVGMNNLVNRRWGTVEELKSTGNIALVRAIELRERIARTDAAFLRTDRINASLQDEIILLRTDLVASFRNDAPSFTTGDPVVVSYDFQDLVDDQEFQAKFAMADLKSQTIVRFNRDYLKEVVILCDYLSNTLEQPNCDVLLGD